MALSTLCQTPGTWFDTRISHDRIDLTVTLPPGTLQINGAQAQLLEANLHNVLEIVLSGFFKKGLTN